MGAEFSRQFYLPYGSLRATSGSATPTDIGFTGQRLDATGLMFYNARYYDAMLGRFINADTLIPNAGNPQAFNRYSYTLNNPVKYNDPTGHYTGCNAYTEREACAVNDVDHIKEVYNITIVTQDKEWTQDDLSTLSYALAAMDDKLQGNLKELVSGAKLQLQEYIANAECPLCTYGGETVNSTITFYTKGSSAIRQMNMYHEFGHLIDNVPGMRDVFTNALKAWIILAS